VTLGSRGRTLLQVAWVLAAMICASAWADALETITLQHRSAEDLIPVLQPLLPTGAAIAGTGSVLLVRAEPAALEQVRQAIAMLDRAPRQLLITVGQDTDSQSQRAGAEGSGVVRSGDVRVGVNAPPSAHDGAEIVVHGSDRRGRIRTVSSVRALEGYEAYVALGESRPFTSGSVTVATHGGVITSQRTDYRDVLTGFYATPHLNGDRVTLEISPQQSQVAPGQRGTVATQSLATTVSGRLGEWIEVGGASGNQRGSTAGLATWDTRTEATQYSAWIKVDEVQ
jgi:hypothetical protein